jgi:diguanylate cyclase (GGDEF)-like protein
VFAISETLRIGSYAMSSVEWQRWLPLAVAACVLPFLLHSLRTNWLAREHSRLNDELTEAGEKLRHLRKKNSVERDENRLLLLFLSQPTAKRLANVLLRRLVNRPQRGFAVIIQWLGEEQRLEFSRGMSEESRRQFRLPGKLVERLSKEPLISLEKQSLYDSGLLELLSPRDRGKVERLVVVASADEEGQLVCALVTTQWFRRSPQPQRLDDLAARLIQAIGHSLLKERDFEIQKNQLRLTADMLQLRSIADRTVESPAVMIQEYLSCLMHLLRADRMAFFLNADSLVGESNVIRCGENLPPGIASRWSTHEERLLDGCRDRPAISALSTAELQRAGVQSLIGSALVVPLVKDGRTIAHVCCTRRRRESFSASQRDLAAWAAEDFTHAIHRLLQHIATTRQARIDALTELANRRVFDQRIEREWDRSRMTSEPCSLLMLDLDRFKLVNDTYGHQAGDYVLRKVSQQLKDRFQEVRKEDDVLLARYGGEELAVLLPGMTEDGAARIAESIRSAIETSEFQFQTKRISITVSIGVATFPDHAKTVAGLISAADSALYFAKQSGRNRIRRASQAPSVDDPRNLHESPSDDVRCATHEG